MSGIWVLKDVLNFINNGVETANLGPFLFQDSDANSAIVGYVKVKNGGFKLEFGRGIGIVLGH